jgi:hypothetical protein
MRGLDPRIHQSSKEYWVKPGNDSYGRPCESRDPYAVTSQYFTVLVANISMK